MNCVDSRHDFSRYAHNIQVRNHELCIETSKSGLSALGCSYLRRRRGHGPLVDAAEILRWDVGCPQPREESEAD